VCMTVDRRNLLSLALLAAGLAVSDPARSADPPGAAAAAAEALFREGRRLLEEGKTAEACLRFAESQRMEPAIGTALNLGDCYDRVGKTASARSAFLDAQSLARKEADEERGAEAQHRLDALEPRLVKLVLTVPASSRVAGLAVRRDGEMVPAESWGAAIPVDPGDHTIEATATGRKPWKKSLRADSAGRVEVVIPLLEEAKKNVLPTGNSTLRMSGIIVGSAGMASLAVAGGFTIAAARTNENSFAYCDAPAQPNRCSARGVVLRDKAIAYATTATVTVAVGAAAVGIGVLLYELGKERRPKDSPRIGWISPSFDASGGRVLLGGSF